MDAMERCSPQTFTCIFRLSPEEFYALLDKIKPDLEKSGRSNYPGIDEGSVDDVITPMTKLAGGLRWLAGGAV
jgi:hypothetical protein